MPWHLLQLSKVFVRFLLQDMKKRGPLDQFFRPAPSDSVQPPVEQAEEELQDAFLPEQQISPPQNTQVAHQLDPAAAISNDIGRFVSVSRRAISDQDRLLLINDPWMPPLGYEFPLLEDGGHRRAFQAKWLQMYTWARYSPSIQGVFCVACVLFGQDEATRARQALRMFVTEPLNRFKKGLEYLNEHGSKTYHKENAARLNGFLETRRNPGAAVGNQLDIQRREEIQKNRLYLRPIIKSVIFCGKQNLALRGHRDDGQVLETDDDGVFRALLRFRIDSGDAVLAEGLEQASRNATYTSKTTQNEIIACAGELIQADISRRVREAKWYSIMADETSDTARLEQATIIIRYLDKSGSIHEDFAGFVHADNLTGEGMAQLIIGFLGHMGLTLDYCRGQGYDGAAAMMGKFNGCQAVIRRQQPLAVPIHCFNHRLNLAVSKSCDVPAVRNMFGTMNRICDFILSSPKRVKEMEEFIDAREEGGRQRRLRMYCATRWVDSHDSVLVFLDLLPVVVDTLSALAHARGAGTTGADAAALLAAVRSSGFLVSLQVAGHCLAKTVSLSRALQDPSQNIGDAIARIMAVRKALEDERGVADEVFHRVFQSASELADKIGEELTAPRIRGRQTHRANAPADGPEEYYKRNIFIPFLDHLIDQLKMRFGDEDNVPKQVRLQELMPIAMTTTSLPRIIEAAELFEFDLNRSILEVEAEVKTWMSLIQSLPQERQPKDIPEAILLGKDNFLPAVTTLLRLFGTIPVSNATAERSFSALKRLKTYLRSTMGEERLTGLALLHVNKSTDVDPDAIIEIYAGKKERRIRLV